MGPLQQGALLRHFLAVAQERSVSAAARALAISQPALTRSIRRLETDLGVALFERLPRGMALTSFGNVLFRHAQRIATEIQFAEAEMDAFREGHAGRLRVGAGPFWGATIVPVGIARLQQRFPKLAVHLDVGVNAVIVPKLFDGELDLVFGAIPEPDALPPFILRREFLANDIRVVCAANHPLLQRTRMGAAGPPQGARSPSGGQRVAQGGSIRAAGPPQGARPPRGERREATQRAPTITARDLAPFPWVVYQQDHDVIARLLAAMKNAGAAPPVIRVESTSMSALIRLLKVGPYLACVSEALINAQPDLGIRIVPLAMDIWRFSTGMLLHRSLEHHAPAVALADYVHEEVKTLKRAPAAPVRAMRR